MIRFLSHFPTAILLLLFGLFPSMSAADTVVPGGSVAGTWTASGSPYLVQGNITIPAASDLHIEPGVEVRFQGHFGLTVNGLLEAVGTETDSISFLAADINSFWFGIQFSNAPDSSHLVFCNVSQVGQMLYDLCGIICINSNPVIAHCRISNNTTRLHSTSHAAGISLNNSNAEISWCDITDNTGGDNSAGIFILNSSPAITNCNISNNYGQYRGGGVSIAGNSFPMITRCTIEGNLSNNFGGGIYSEGGVVTISECTIGYNGAAEEGGGISIHGGNVFLDHCILEFNQCLDYGRMEGGGVFISGGTLTADHCIFYKNFVYPLDNDGLDIHITGSAEATITNNIFYNDWFVISFSSDSPVSVSYNDFHIFYSPWWFGGNIPTGLGSLTQVNYNGDSCDAFYNIYLDPLFVDNDNGDYHLTGESPCIDAGCPESPHDPDSTISDIGPFYHDLLSGIDDVNGILPEGISLSQNYPNPFNPRTTVSFSIDRSQNVELAVFDMTGKRIAVLADRVFEGGTHSLEWEGNDLLGNAVASGTYLLRMVSDEGLAVEKMMLIR